MPLVPLHTDVTDALHTHYKAMAHAARDAEKRTFAVTVPPASSGLGQLRAYRYLAPSLSPLRA